MKNSHEFKTASDVELALFLIGHINNPCSDLKGNTLRNFYIEEAKKALKNFKNPGAKVMLEDVINQYPEE